MKVKDVAKLNQLNVTAGYPYPEVYYIDTSSVTEGDFNPPQRLSLNDAPSRAKRIVRHNDILISTVRPNLRHNGICKNPAINTVVSTGFVVITCHGGCPDYLYRLLTTRWYTDFLQGIAESQQSNYPAFNPSLIENTVIELPSFRSQSNIAATLSAYDELLQNNKQRIGLLETLAEEIYREWFVRLRFPGHKSAKFRAGQPKTWKCFRVGAIVNRLKFGRIYRADELQPEGSVCVIDQSTDAFLGFYQGEPEHIASTDQPILLFGDHSCKMVFMTKPFSLAENVVPFTPRAPIESAYFLFHLVRDLTRTTEYKRHWTDLTTHEVLVPEGPLQTRFEAIAKPLHQQAALLAQWNQSLVKSRDLLLPRLMSGNLSVGNLDIQFPPGMAEELNDQPAAVADA